MYFQEIIENLNKFWKKEGCIIFTPYNSEVGAGTFNPGTFLRCLGKKPWKCAYFEPTRRPKDGRYGDNPNRVLQYFQYQVVLKPPPEDVQEIYLNSLRTLGIKIEDHDVRFVEDDWESETLGAWGIGWEVWLDGLEITQFTYFQQIGGIDLDPITCEITYGLERIAMFLQNKKSIFDIDWNENIKWGDIYWQNEKEFSEYYYHIANPDLWKHFFEEMYKETEKLIEKNLIMPAYDGVIKISHAFNILDARGVISPAERQMMIQRIRKLANLVAKRYIEKNG